MTETTIHFDTAVEAAELTSPQAGFLPRIEEALGVRLVARDTWLQMEGEPANVELADRFFRLLRKARGQRVALPEQTLRYALRAFQQGRAADVERLFELGVPVGRGKPNVYPRTFGQQAYLLQIMEKDIVLGIGPAGTGKTYLAMAMAVSWLLQEKVNRIILTRPAIEAGEALGYLPGDMYQKVLPYLRPLNDALYDMLDADTIQRCMDQGVIEVAPIAYMRGRTLNNSFIILDEAQNTTQEQMLMFLTRMGFGSRCVITGDVTQIDLPQHKQSGLLEARSTLARIGGIGISEFTESDVVRHTLVQQIIRAYSEVRGARNPAGSP